MEFGAITFRATEAAVVAQVNLRDVNRTIDEDIIPPSLLSLAGHEREILPAACIFIAFYVETAEELTSKMRKWIIRHAVERLGLSWSTLIETAVRGQPALDLSFSHAFVTVDLAPFVWRASEGWEILRAVRNFARIDEGIVGGSMPVISGTRIPVHDVAASLKTSSVEAVLHDYPSLDAGQVELARVYAEAYPLRGRPATRMSAAPDVAPRSSRRIRRKTA